jgi:hypothetical protein
MHWSSRRPGAPAAGSGRSPPKRPQTSGAEGVSPVLEAMAKLDKSPSKEGQPSLVRQLYALALLNREDAMRRLNERMPTDMLLAQQPPSLLALAGPPDSVSPAFRQRPFTSPASSSRRGKWPEPLPPRRQRQFGAVSLNSGMSGSTGGVYAIAAARAPSLATTAMGAPAAPGRPRRVGSPWSTRPPMTAPTSSYAGGEGYGVGPGMGSGVGYGVRGDSMPELPPAHGSAVGERSHTAAAASGRPRPPPAAAPAPLPPPPPLRATDLETVYPIRESSLPPRDVALALAAAQRDEILGQVDKQRAGAQARGSLLPVRALLEASAPEPSNRTRRRAEERADGLYGLSHVASSTAKPLGYGGVSDGLHRETPQYRIDALRHESTRFADGSKYVADPREAALKSGRFDPWAAAEEDMLRREQQKAVSEEMHAVRMAAAVGSGFGVVPGFT